MSDPTADAVARAFRDERAAVLATLIRHVGDFQLAEDAVQDAYAAALATWPRDGVPANPGAWLTLTARRRAIDRLRRDRSVADRAERVAELVRLDQQEHRAVSEESSIVDDRLRLIFTCCHPALDVSARVALTLRALGGLTTGEIARAFLVAEPTFGKRIGGPSGRSPTLGSRTRCRATKSSRIECAGCFGWSIGSSTRAIPRPRATVSRARSCATRRSGSACCDAR